MRVRRGAFRVIFLTMKGWLIEAKIEFSESTWSTCLRRIISAFLSILRATTFLDYLCLASFTLPKDPKYIQFAQELNACHWNGKNWCISGEQLTCAEGSLNLIITKLQFFRALETIHYGDSACRFREKGANKKNKSIRGVMVL